MHVGGNARVDGVRLEVGVEEAFTVAVERFIVAFKPKRVCDFLPNFANSRFHDTSVDNVWNAGWTQGCGQNWNQGQNRGRGMTPGRTFHRSRSSRSQSNQTRTCGRLLERFYYKKVFLFWFYFSKAD